MPRSTPVGLLLALLLAAHAGCARSQFLVPGLTLPPGTALQTQTVVTGISPALQDLSEIGPVEKALTVSFGSANWETLTAYVEKQLLSKGYSDNTPGMVHVLATAGSGMRGSDIVKATRLYDNPRSPYIVILMDLQQIRAAPKGGQDFAWPSVTSSNGQYLLTVFKKQ